MWPSDRTTRWHGMSSGTGLWPSAVPTARTAAGWPISAAIQPYGRTSPRGIWSAFSRTARSNVGAAAQVDLDPGPAVAGETTRDRLGQRAAAARRHAGSAGRADARTRPRTPVASWAVLTAETPRPFQATQTSPIALESGAYRSASPTATSVAGRSVDWGARAQVVQGGLDPVVRPSSGRVRAGSCDRLLALVRLDGGAKQGEAPVDLGLDGALGPAEDVAHLLVGQAVDVAQHHGGAVEDGQAADEARPTSRSDSRRIDRSCGVSMAGAANWRSARSPATSHRRVRVRRSVAGPAEVQHDRREPRPQLELRDPWPRRSRRRARYARTKPSWTTSSASAASPRKRRARPYRAGPGGRARAASNVASRSLARPGRRSSSIGSTPLNTAARPAGCIFARQSVRGPLR